MNTFIYNNKRFVTDKIYIYYKGGKYNSLRLWRKTDKLFEKTKIMSRNTIYYYYIVDGKFSFCNETEHLLSCRKKNSLEDEH